MLSVLCCWVFYLVQLYIVITQIWSTYIFSFVNFWIAALVFIPFTQIILFQNADWKISFPVHNIADYVSPFALPHRFLFTCYITLGHFLSSPFYAISLVHGHAANLLIAFANLIIQLLSFKEELSCFLSECPLLGKISLKTWTNLECCYVSETA